MSQSPEGASQLAFSRGTTDPAQYSSPDAKERFAVAKYLGAGSDGQWSVEEIADALEVSTRQVYRYINESEIGKEVRETMAMTDAEWRLDAALRLREEIERLEELERDLLERTTAVATEFEDRKIEGTPTRDGQVVISDAKEEEIRVAVPTEYKEVVDYGPELERVQKEKRQHIKQIMKLLGLDIHNRPPGERQSSEGPDRPLVEYREREAVDQGEGNV